MIYGLIIGLLLISNAVSIIFYLRLKAKFTKLLDKHASRPDSVELSEFLFDIRAGSSLLQVKRLDSSGVMIRSPRG